MLDVETQLRGYGEQLDASRVPVEVEEVLSVPVGPEPVRPIRVREPKQRRLRWAAALAAGVVVLLLVGGLAWLVRSLGRQSAPVITETPTTIEPSPTTTVITPTTVGPSPTTTVIAPTTTTQVAPPTTALAPDPLSAGSWTRHTLAPGLVTEGFFGFVNDVAQAGTGFVAVGSEEEPPLFCDRDRSCRAAVWVSPDGIGWSRAIPDGEAFENASMFTVTRGGPGFIAAGATNGAVAESAVVWVSEDGLSWSRVPRSTSPQGAAIRDIAAISDTLVAIVAPIGDYSVPIKHPWIWTSTDGVVWSPVPNDVSGLESAELEAISAGGPGLIAGGSHAGQGSTPGFWTSADGIHWQPAQVQQEFDDVLLLATGERGAIASGFFGTRPGRETRDSANLWFSPDGTDWEVAFPFASQLEGLAVFDRGFVAIASNDQGGVVYSSLDGETWDLNIAALSEEFDLFKDAHLSVVVARGRGLLVMGQECTGSPDCPLAVWTWEPAD